MAFTVATEACTATLNWTGIEGAFVAGFPALDPSHITVTYTPAVGPPVVLTGGIQVTIACDPATGAVTVTPLAMPAAPGTVTIDRHTPANQQINFVNLASFSADTHTFLADQAEMGIAEVRRDLARAIINAAGVPLATLLVLLSARVQRAVVATPIVIAQADQILNCNIPVAAACALPKAATRNGIPLTFKDLGQAAAHNITLTPFGAETIAGVNAAVALTVNRQELTLVPFNDGVNSGWEIG